MAASLLLRRPGLLPAMHTSAALDTAHSMIIYGGAFTPKRGGISVPQGGLAIDPDPDVIKAYRRK
jgi:hypothetical protein